MDLAIGSSLKHLKVKPVKTRIRYGKRTIKCLGLTGKELKTCNATRMLRIEMNIKKPWPWNIYLSCLFFEREYTITSKYKEANGKPENRKPIDSFSPIKENWRSRIETKAKKSSRRPIKNKHSMHTKRKNNVITTG